ncbi:uncharacterized protein SOCE836_062660 [Sorangium cellulosum]|uniref:Uncharacterized protein n=1 Tax=Sorangium cellulosum TaxID=56 RepID=A0A4P2QVB3_SORCE|nr:uncharacterized protein SOCE836_062660 [Sorangium cellulosum]
MATSCPPDGVVRAPHALVTVEPLSAMVMPQAVVVVRLVVVFVTFVKVTFAQYPVDHCDWSAMFASIEESALRSSPSSDSISSPSP